MIVGNKVLVFNGGNVEFSSCIWPESPSFNDEGLGEVPSRWKGVCMAAKDFKKSNCNRKLIGARYYETPLTPKANQSRLSKSSGSPRDSVGHGTHVASTAGGARVANASYFGLARGTARGGLPSTRIASYKACASEGCSGATILKAIDDAVKDGVDIISISIGLTSLDESDYLDDPIAIGAFHAEEKGVLVVCSAGNDGPDPHTVGNTAPWIFTVAASSIDRHFQSSVLLGNGKTYKGFAINFSELSRKKTYPLVFAQDVAANFTPGSEARNCYPGSLDPKKVAGKIVVCAGDDPTVSRRVKKLVVEDAKAKGVIVISEVLNGVPFDSGVFAFTQVNNDAGSQILEYINSTKKPTATILPTVEVPRYRPAPVVAYFSSRGPSRLTENILKPDIMAPGVSILAAMIPKNEPGSVPFGKKPSQFALKSGTSMACPHVSGAAAFIKALRPRWTSSIIRSALMTTASTFNNLGKPFTNSSDYIANPHEVGVGEINPFKALNPGLVFETSTTNYLQFLCFNGYTEKTIKALSSIKFNCPKSSVEEFISNINYPSISISQLNRHEHARVIKRTVTNVGAANSTYIANVQSPPGLVVKVFPEKIIFTKGLKKASFQVSFDGKKAQKGYNFGSVTWSGERYSVRVVFGVNVE
nr:CO(2)-response secreted protease-like isoform X2 [Ziziphus jujuba var. spinosa]